MTDMTYLLVRNNQKLSSLHYPDLMKEQINGESFHIIQLRTNERSS